MRILTWITSRLRSILGLDWIEEARDIAEASRKRQNVVEHQLRRARGEPTHDGY